MNNLEHTCKKVWDVAEHAPIHAFAEDYKQFLNCCKTERESASRVVALAKAAGFRDLDELYAAGVQLAPGDKVYALRHNKAAALFVIGQKPLRQGMHLISAHIDAPRLDLRPNPLTEKDGLAQMKTHYYGGIKKYQWAAQPLALHGTIVRKGGTHVDIAIGEAETDPVFYISDLPKHLSADQAKKSMGDGIDGEHLNILVGSIPLTDGTVRSHVLRMLHDCYGVREEDLISAELEVVPAGKARDVGFDRGLICAYAHDDRVCSYTALRAILETEAPAYTSGLILADKEEIGSVGATGMNSHLMENLAAMVVELTGDTGYAATRLALERSKLLSADVTVAFDPSYPEVFEPANATHLGRGPVMLKYAGHMGKKSANDAGAEFLAYLRDVLDAANVTWQAGEFGKVDQGGGGTIAPFAAAYGMHVVDFGVALLSMHAPYELASKADVYEAYRAYKAFLATDADLGKYFG